MRPPGTAAQLEKRQRRAIALLQAGTPYREVARRVEASLNSIVRWERDSCDHVACRLHSKSS